MRKFLIITCNILLTIILFFTLEFIVYVVQVNINKSTIESNEKPQFEYDIINPSIIFKDFKINDYDLFRKPEGTDYSDNPITIFGCSVAYGQLLNADESLGHLLSQETKRPVYNRSMVGAGVQQMLYQTQMEDFYKEVPKSKDIIYVFIPDHYHRMLALPFNITNRTIYFHYKYKNGKFIPYNSHNYLSNLIQTSYLINYFRQLYYYKYQVSSKHINKLSDEALQYFIQSRAEIQKHTNRAFNFYVLIYQKYNGAQYFKKILEQSGFKVIMIEDLTTEDLTKPPYLAEDNMHPSKEVWKLITPKIAKIISQKL